MAQTVSEWIFQEEKKAFQSDDPIVAAVIRKMYQRSQVGIKKYGTTMERNDLSYAE